jgi:hypothetical protein
MENFLGKEIYTSIKVPEKFKGTVYHNQNTL